MKLRNVICFIVLSVAFNALILNFDTYAEPYTMCNGTEFNARVMSFLSGGDPNANRNATVTSFEKGNNPPTDPAYYVDISEDRDGSVIAYTRAADPNDCRSTNNQVLYYYSDSQVMMNEDASYMFNGFTTIRSIDLRNFVYMNDLHDTRYMFANCRRLKTIRFKESDIQPLNLTEVQGMFYNCQSLSFVDLRYFTTYHVDNMDEMFYRCFNLRNIYVNKDRWNTESVRTFNKMFSECHSLKTNDGRKAVDIPSDSYEKFAVPGDEKTEGLLKDIKTTYIDYGGEDAEVSVPVEDAGYPIVRPETIARYAYEPEDEGVAPSDDSAPYVGDKNTGYGATKEIGQSGSVYGAETTGADAGESINLGDDVTIIESTVEVIPETSSVSPAEDQSEDAESIESEQVMESESRRIIEIDGIDESGNKEAEDAGQLFNDNTKFLIFALGISIFVIILLIGMVMYLLKDNSGDKNSDKL